MTLFAAIDCGSNSTRLLISDHRGVAIERQLRVTRLGEGVDSGRRLLPAAMERTLDAVTEFAGMIDAHEVDHVVAIATSAVRDSDNRDEFRGRVAKALNTDLRILTGEEEGLLTYAGATSGLESPPYFVVDIGGGSTELALGRPALATGVDVLSLDAGCVRITEQFLHSDPYSAAELANAFAAVEAMMLEVTAVLPMGRPAPSLVGVAGTITSLAAMDLGLTRYERVRTHHHVLLRQSVEELFRSLAGQTEVERASDPTMAEKRSDVIVGGTVVLLGLMRHFGFHECLVSETDILDGLVSDAISQKTT